MDTDEDLKALRKAMEWASKLSTAGRQYLIAWLQAHPTIELRDEEPRA